jgi:hypothetical protein
VTGTDDRPWIADLARLDALVATGLPRQTVRRRVRRGRWREPLSGVVCRTDGRLTVDQWRVAALLYGSAGSALSHASAGEFWGFGRATGPVHITVPHGRHLGSTQHVIVHQSRRPYSPVLIDELLLTPPARKAVDLSLQLRSLDSVQQLLGRAVQRGRVTVQDLDEEIAQAPRRGSAFARQTLADLAAGSRAASESRLLRLLQRAGFPMPELNAAVPTAIGTRYVDALWRLLGRGVEVDGQAWHLSPASWRADLARQNAIQSAGVVLLRIAARRLWTEPDAVISEIAAFLGLPRP